MQPEQPTQPEELGTVRKPAFATANASAQPGWNLPYSQDAVLNTPRVVFREDSYDGRTDGQMFRILPNDRRALSPTLAVVHVEHVGGPKCGIHATIYLHTI